MQVWNQHEYFKNVFLDSINAPNPQPSALPLYMMEEHFHSFALPRSNLNFWIVSNQIEHYPSIGIGDFWYQEWGLTLISEIQSWFQDCSWHWLQDPDIKFWFQHFSRSLISNFDSSIVPGPWYQILIPALFQVPDIKSWFQDAQRWGGGRERVYGVSVQGEGRGDHLSGRRRWEALCQKRIAH